MHSAGFTCGAPESAFFDQTLKPISMSRASVTGPIQTVWNPEQFARYYRYVQQNSSRNSLPPYYTDLADVMKPSDVKLVVHAAIALNIATPHILDDLNAEPVALLERLYDEVARVQRETGAGEPVDLLREAFLCADEFNASGALRFALKKQYGRGAARSRELQPADMGLLHAASNLRAKDVAALQPALEQLGLRCPAQKQIPRARLDSCDGYDLMQLLRATGHCPYDSAPKHAQEPGAFLTCVRQCWERDRRSHRLKHALRVLEQAYELSQSHKGSKSPSYADEPTPGSAPPLAHSEMVREPDQTAPLDANLAAESHSSAAPAAPDMSREPLFSSERSVVPFPTRSMPRSNSPAYPFSNTRQVAPAVQLDTPSEALAVAQAGSPGAGAAPTSCPTPTPTSYPIVSGAAVVGRLPDDTPAVTFALQSPAAESVARPQYSNLQNGSEQVSDTAPTHSLALLSPTPSPASVLESLGLPQKKKKLLSEVQQLRQELITQPLTHEQLVERAQEPDRYPNERTGLTDGLMLVFNCVNTNGQEPRPGSLHDLDNLKSLAEFLGFRYSEHLDRNREDLERELRTALEHPFQEVGGALWLVLMGHGTQEGILCSDGVTLRLAEIRRWLSTAPALYGVPKFVTVVGCRHAPSSTPRAQRCATIPPMCFDESIGSDRVRIEMPADGPDFLWAMSTIEGYVSLLSKEAGSGFIYKICEIFRARAEHEDACAMLTQVNKYFKSTPFGIHQQHRVQPEFRSTLSDPLYLFNRSTPRC